MKVEEKKVVGMHYTLHLEDGLIADSSEGEEPLYFLCGMGNIVPGLEKELMNLSVGAKKTVEVNPEEAYGDLDPEAYEEFPRSIFENMFQDEEGEEPVKMEAGMPVVMMDEDGEYIPATIHELKDDIIIVNFNHPLAGKKLKFDVEIVEIREATEEELAHGHVHSGEHHHH